MGATLGLAGVDAVVVERADAVAPAWRSHYERLHLHTVRWLSHLPAYPIPRRYGRWVARDDVVAYLEDYARRHRLNVRCGVTVERLDREDGRWRVRTSAGDVLATYVVVATGHNHTPVIPDWPGRDGFNGELVHSKDYRSAERYGGHDVLVVGTGNTGAEIAVELVEKGASRVRLSVRTPPHIVPRDAGGLPGQVVGVAVRRLPPSIGDRIIRMNQRLFIGDLSDHGLPIPDEGVYSHLLRTGGVPVLDIGLADLVREGRVEVVAAVAALDGDEVVLVDGSRIAPDAVIAATGFERRLEPLIGHLGLIGAHGRPVVHGPYTHPDAPRLHFIGFSDPISGMFRELNLDAWKIARAIASDRDGPPENVTHRPGPLGDRALAQAAIRLRRLRGASAS